MIQNMKTKHLIISAMLVSSTVVNAAEPKAPKNVVGIFADDMGYGGVDV
jgi:hypothetical protein